MARSGITSVLITGHRLSTQSASSILNAGHSGHYGDTRGIIDILP